MYLSEFEVKRLAEGLATEVPEAFVGGINPDQRFQQEPNWFHHLRHHQVYGHRHEDLFICHRDKKYNK